MYIKNIYGKKINVNLIAFDIDEIKLFPDSFKKTQEFKNLKAQKYITEVDAPNEDENSKE